MESADGVVIVCVTQRWHMSLVHARPCCRPLPPARRLGWTCFCLLQGAAPIVPPRAEEPWCGKTGKVFFFFLSKLDTTRQRAGLFFWLRFGRVDNTGGGGASSNGRGERSQWQLLACGTVRLTSGAANQINKRLISLKGNSSDFNQILITADRCLLVTL